MIRQRPHYRFRLPENHARPWVAAAPSVVAHVILILLATRATTIAARELKEAIDRKIAYLPPPDRRPNSEATVEHLQYIELGGGVLAVEAKLNRDQLQVIAGPKRAMTPGGDLGDKLKSISAAIGSVSLDSVYSEIEVEERAARLPGSAAPAYPAELMRQRVEGAVLVRFVVDTSGRVEPSSIQVINSTNEQFAIAVKSAMPRMFFTPATVSGHAVRQAVEQNFRFRLPQQAPAQGAKPV